MPKAGQNYITPLNYRIILINPLIKEVFSCNNTGKDG
jgi:hypothetical protein